jgi:phosphoribosylformimino-5-aminoimidazole carboxamide ribonucleotide (ProFAR) isomerase
MSGSARRGSTTDRPAAPPTGPSLVPCLLLRDGRVCLPGPTGPVAARTADGEYFDPFDVVDHLARDFALLYVVDLDGIEKADAQLDYLQELSRDLPLWVDAGVRTADQAIDVIVAGARRAVLSSAYLRGPKELRRAWKLTTELVFEIELENATLTPADPSWEENDPYEFLRSLRDVGIDHFVVSPRETDPNWGLIRRLASLGRVWVDGTFTPAEQARLTEAGAAGGIFHIDEILKGMSPSPSGP